MGFMDGYNMTAGNRQLRLQEQQAQFNNNLALQQLAEQRSNEAKRLAQTSKAAETFVKANPNVLQTVGMTDQEFANLSADQQIGVVDGFYKSQATRQVMQELAAKQRQAEQDQVFADTLRQRARTTLTIPAVGADPTGLTNFAAMPSRPVPADRALTRQDVLAAIAAAPTSPQAIDLLKAVQSGDEASSFFNPNDVGRLREIQGAPGYGLAVTGPRQSQVIYTGGPQGSSVNVPGVGDVGVITTKPGQSTIVPGQQTQGQIREALAKAEADIAKLQTKIKADPEMGQYLAGALAEQESLAQSYRAALGGQGGTVNNNSKPPSPVPAIGTVVSGYRYKGGNPNQQSSWEKVQ